MRLNEDLTKRCVINTAQAAWLASPALGVERKPLDRNGGEVARATTVVRFAPESRFAAHEHGAGEEFLVLEGTFSDEFGDYPAGTYVRNPPGSQHAPFSRSGCTLFVKLRQIASDDDAHVVIDTQSPSAAWKPGPVPGLSILFLHEHGAEHVALERWQPGTRLDWHHHAGGEEIFVLSGSFADEHGIYPAGTWLRNPPGSEHVPFTKEGCTIYVKTGHLGASDGS